MNEQVVPERAPSATEKPTSEFSATSPASIAPTLDLPPIAADADDLRVIKQAVDDAASVGGALWLSYLFVLFYLAVATGAVTHADLFFENPVKLPFLNIELPLLAFFFIAPILFLVVHAYTLVHLVMLTDKAKRYHQALYDQIGDKNCLSEKESKKRKLIRDGLRRQLPSNIFVQFLVGSSDRRKSTFGWLLRAVAWITLVVAPVSLLLLMQVQFLPFHSRFITWTHRIVLLLDLGLIWWLWRTILSGREADRHSRWVSWVWTGLGVSFSACAFLFSWAAATFSGEWQDNRLFPWPVFPTSDESGQSIHVSLHDWLFDSKVDPESGRRWLPLSSTLVLSGLNVYEGRGVDDPKKAEWREYVFRARGRDLRGAVFDFAVLPKIDFEGSDLQNVSFFYAHLQGVSLKYAKLRSAWLPGAQVQGGTLSFADLQGADLSGANLQGAQLSSANLLGADLSAAALQGAMLASAQLQSARLDGASLQGASLAEAQLQGASLERTEFEGASLVWTELQGATLQQSRLGATDLSEAIVWRTNSATPSTDAAPVNLTGSMIWEPLFIGVDRSQRFLRSQSLGDAYQQLLKEIESLAPGYRRDDALRFIQRFDCANPDKTLASCDKTAQILPQADTWRKQLEGSRVTEPTYEKALAAVLKDLVCSGGADAIYVLRGILRDRFSSTRHIHIYSRLVETGPSAPALINFILSKDCLISGSLTDDDRARLLKVRKDALNNEGP
jgi:uncharacterized protein YjbI with pentapeptide repeats